MKTLISALCLISISSSALARGSASDFLTIAGDVPREQSQLIESDLERLAAMPINVNNPEAAKIMDIDASITNASLLQWLSQRIRYIVGESFELSEKSLKVMQSNYSYQNPGVLPDIPKGGKSAGVAEPGGRTVKTVMTNIGSAVYMVGKMSNTLLGLKVPGKFSKVGVSSPRIGLLQVGEGLFILDKHQPKTATINDIDSSLMRLGTLFHEARHSDGNGKSIGMIHATCPEGHAYAGYSACDFSLNGAYSVGAVTGQILAENCAACTPAQKEVLRLDYLEAFSRVLKEKELPASSGSSDIARMTLDALMATKGACEILNKHGGDSGKELCKDIDQKIEAAKAAMTAGPTKQVMKAQFLDSRPEGL